MAKIISITNTKGGTGKSTVTILLASALAIEDKKRVLVLDCDVQNSIINLRNMELSEEEENISFDVKGIQPQFISDTLDIYKDKYDYIFLDLPRVTSDAQSNLFYGLVAKCEFVFIPLKPSSLTLSSTLAFLRGVQQLEAFKMEQSVPFVVRGFFNESERHKNIKTVLDVVKANNLETMKTSIPRLRVFEDVSTIENPFSFTDGLLRFKPFYNEFKKLINHG